MTKESFMLVTVGAYYTSAYLLCVCVCVCVCVYVRVRACVCVGRISGDEFREAWWIFNIVFE